MWAQLIKARVKPGTEADLARAFGQMRAVEQPGSGLLRTSVMRSQDDPGLLYVLVVFESEEKARAREQDPRRREGLQAANAALAEVFDGPPEFADLSVLEEWAV